METRLLERETQLQQMTETMEAVIAGSGSIILVSGEAGIGKTSFVTAAVERFRSRARILWGACDPLFTPRPLGPVYDIAAGDLAPLLEKLSAGEDWLAIATALHQDLRHG